VHDASQGAHILLRGTRTGGEALLRFSRILEDAVAGLSEPLVVGSTLALERAETERGRRSAAANQHRPRAT
jgi:hypothetical protein